MTEQDYRLLELLLGKLQLELGNDYCIVPNHVHDGYYMALYNGSGERFKDLSGPTIKSCIDQFQNENSLV